jgi:hypothetical protein
MRLQEKIEAAVYKFSQNQLTWSCSRACLGTADVHRIVARIRVPICRVQKTATALARPHYG